MPERACCVAPAGAYRLEHTHLPPPSPTHTPRTPSRWTCCRPPPAPPTQRCRWSGPWADSAWRWRCTCCSLGECERDQRSCAVAVFPSWQCHHSPVLKPALTACLPIQRGGVILAWNVRRAAAAVGPSLALAMKQALQLTSLGGEERTTAAAAIPDIVLPGMCWLACWKVCLMHPASLPPPRPTPSCNTLVALPLLMPTHPLPCPHRLPCMQLLHCNCCWRW